MAIFNITYGLTTSPWPSPRASKRKPYTSPVKGFPNILASHPTGSRYICNPPVTTSDDDRFILVDAFPDELSMNKLGWTMDTGEEQYPSGDFQSYRNGEKNYILVTSKDHYIRSVAATLLAKEMNLTDKKDRIHLFSFLQGKEWVYSGKLPDKGLL